MKHTLTFFALFISIISFAQVPKLSILVKTDKSDSPEFATISLRTAKDSSLVFGGVLDEKGFVQIPVKANTKYKIYVSKIGLKPVNQVVAITKRDTLIELYMTTSTATLSEATVTAKVKLMTQDDDKTIVDAEQLAKMASNALEVLEKTPGIIVVNEEIYLGKAEAAKIYINGREMKLGSSDLASILKSMPPNSVSKIEIMRTPSAKFDASSSGDIINIVLKKGIRLGTNGTSNLNYTQGRYHKFSTGFTLNHGDEVQNAYVNYQYGNRNNFEDLQSQRTFGNDNTNLFQRAYTTTPAQTHYLAMGIDRTITPKLNIADDLILNFDNGKSNTQNISDLYFIGNNNLFNSNKSLINNDLSKINVNNTLSSIYKLDTIGSEWSNSFNYVYASNVTQQAYENTFSSNNKTNFGTGNIDNGRHIGSLVSDFTKKFQNKFKIEAGIKLDVLTNDAKADFLINKNNDAAKSITYKYNENINAAYFQVSIPFYGISVKTGLRLENTNMIGRQLSPRDTMFTVHRSDLFPYLYVSRKLFTLFKNFDLNGNFIARRSITRPNYSILNPAVQVVDPFYVQTGNPSLKPQFTNTYEFNISFADYPVIAFGMDETKDVFGKVIYQNPSTKVFTETYDNLGNLKQYYMRLVGGIPPGGTYFGIVGTMYNYQIYRGLYQGQPLDFRRGTWNIFTYHELKFNKNSFLSANGFLQIKGVTNFYELKNFGQLSLTYNHKFPKQHLQVILTANDILYTMKPDFVLQQGGIDASGQRVNDSRKFGVTIRYNFGVETGMKKKKDEGGNIFDMVNPSKRTN